MFTATVKTDDSGAQQIIEAIECLQKTQVLVGIPEAKDARKEGEMTNAGLLYIHSNGSPKNNIPARPVIEPAIEHNKENLGELMGEAAKAAMNGDSTGANKQLEMAGMAGQNAAKDWFTNRSNGWAPVKEETQKRKAKRGATDNRPLIDTGELRNAITYTVEERQ